jgi:hypothetical protein
MRIVGVVSQLGVRPGLYAREGINDEEVAGVWEQYKNLATLLQSGGGATGRAAAAAAAATAAQAVGRTAALFILPAFTPILAGAGAALFVYGAWDWIIGRPSRTIRRVERAMMPTTEESGHILASEAVVIPGKLLASDYRDFDSPIFHGLFESKRQLEQLMEANGGHTELHIVSQATANQVYGHPFGGRFKTGLHVPHPKDPKALVPLADMHESVKEEVVHEWGEVFEALGAKKLVIADTTGITVDAKGKHSNPGASVEAQMQLAYGSSVVETSTYAAGVFDPERASTGRRWLGDHPAIMKIVAGRVHGNQTSWRRTVKVDVTAGVSLDVIALAAPSKSKGQLKAEYHRTFDFFVEFYSKDLMGASGP